MSDCALEPYPNSDSTWLWEAHDNFDGAPQPAQLAQTFATKDLAAEFWDAFEKAKRLKWPRANARVMCNHYKTRFGNEYSGVLKKIRALWENVWNHDKIR